MNFSLDAIKSFSTNEEAYLQGKKLYEAGRVKIDSVQSFWKGEVSLKASVKDENELTYPTSIVINEGVFEKIGCSCSEFQKNKSFCKHLVGTSVEYYRMVQKKSPTP